MNQNSRYKNTKQWSEKKNWFKKKNFSQPELICKQCEYGHRIGITLWKENRKQNHENQFKKILNDEIKNKSILYNNIKKESKVNMYQLSKLVIVIRRPR
jgi:hypothetical protein